MIFSKTRPVKIVMIGTGGTGGHIAPHLYRLLCALDRPVRFIVCDGDTVEEKNLVRQNFTKQCLAVRPAGGTLLPAGVSGTVRSGTFLPVPGAARAANTAGAGALCARPAARYLLRYARPPGALPPA